tara:strand:+ start:1743 stop:2624 length:882 start_codon:yes stop_codon:yes gene_type:complete
VSFDLTVYGNLILDNTFCVEQYAHEESNICTARHMSPGASANVVSAISRLDSALSVNISSIIGDDTAGRYIEKWFLNFKKLNSINLNLNLEKSYQNTSEAVIISDLTNKSRSSIVNWGACQTLRNLKNFNSKWSHILYLDKLPNLDLNSLKKLSEESIISVDLCSSNQDLETRETMISMLPYIDYVFASFEEGCCLAQENNPYDASRFIAKKTRGWCILHSPDGSYISEGSHQTTKKYNVADKVTGPVNVLGAGDNLATAFIVDQIKRQSEVSESIKFAQTQATEYIKNNQKE